MITVKLNKKINYIKKLDCHKFVEVSITVLLIQMVFSIFQISLFHFGDADL